MAMTTQQALVVMDKRPKAPDLANWVAQEVASMHSSFAACTTATMRTANADREQKPGLTEIRSSRSSKRCQSRKAQITV
jgi:hypothetical protein